MFYHWNNETMCQVSMIPKESETISQSKLTTKRQKINKRPKMTFNSLLIKYNYKLETSWGNEGDLNTISFIVNLFAWNTTVSEVEKGF